MQLKGGARLGPYEIVGSIGAGGMGEVYRARDPRLQREVAIKILPAALADDPVAHARAPVPPFRTTFEPSSANDQFAIAHDGRILIRRPVGGAGTDQAPIAVLVNWRRIVGLE